MLFIFEDVASISLAIFTSLLAFKITLSLEFFTICLAFLSALEKFEAFPFTVGLTLFMLCELFSSNFSLQEALISLFI